MEITPQQYEATLNQIYDLSSSSPIPIKMTCAPHYIRVAIQQKKLSMPVPHTHCHSEMANGRGCMAGNGFCFVSHIGEVFGCGFLPIAAGNIRKQSFKEIYQQSHLFTEIRNPSLLKGKCGACEYKMQCRGCRARAYSTRGDYLHQEPYCSYKPNNGTEKTY